MPREAPVSKVVAVERLGARVTLAGESVEEALALARERAPRTIRMDRRSSIPSTTST